MLLIAKHFNPVTCNDVTSIWIYVYHNVILNIKEFANFVETNVINEYVRNIKNDHQSTGWNSSLFYEYFNNNVVQDSVLEVSNKLTTNKVERFTKIN